ncbi:MAG: glutathione peroxidase [Sinimarinibacterium flocculans]|uniref:glutathione peroxidase n=1 Tax=Sinimarinibacterium flocculans TaxID=985250 RepID=UPI003C482FF8
MIPAHLATPMRRTIDLPDLEHRPVMRPSIALMAVLLAAALTAPYGAAAAACSSPLLDTSAKRLVGPEESLCEHAGKAVLIVNTASRCGYTPQYEGLEALWQRYRDQGLVVLGFPSDQFGGQEPGDDAEIAKFCKVNYGVSFPMFTKSNVSGRDAIPLYKELIKITGESPKWNFHKYLIARDGRSVQAFGSDVKPDGATLRAAIEAALAR